MNRSALTYVESIANLVDAGEVCRALESLSFSIWSKNPVFLERFIDSQGVETVVNLLRPRTLEHLSTDKTDIELHLFQDKNLTPVHDSFPAVLRGLAAKFIGDLIHSQHNLLPDLLEDYPWLADRLCQMLQSESLIESYGALLGLEVVLWHGSFRNNIEVPEVIDAVVSLLKLSCDTKTKIFRGMRWRLALCRISFDMIQTLSVMNGVDLYGSDCGGLIPLRSDWKCVARDGALLLALLKVFKFCADAIPKAEEEKFGTVFSGPGIFKDSGLQILDLAPIVQTVSFLVHRICTFDEQSKVILMKQTDLVDKLKDLAVYFGDSIRDDMVKFLIFMGLGSPMSQLDAASIAEQLKSDTPKTCYRALRVLSHPDNLLDTEKLASFLREQQGPSLLVNLMIVSPAQTAMSERIGKLKIQRTPARVAIELQPGTQWKTVVRSFAAHTIGHLCMAHNNHMLHAISKDFKKLVEIALLALKSGSDLEKWGMMHWFAGVIKGRALIPSFMDSWSQCSQSLPYVVLKTLSSTSTGTNAKTSLFNNLHDLQWKFETMHDIVSILGFTVQNSLRESPKKAGLPLNELHQAGLIPSLFKLLMDAASLHAALPTSRAAENDLLPAQIQMRYRYNEDDTLPNLIYDVFSLLCTLARQDKFSRDVILWDDHLVIIKTYVNFASSDVTILVRSLLEDLILEISEASPLEAPNDQVTSYRNLSLSTLKNLLKHSLMVEDMWPAHLTPPNPESFLHRRESVGYSASIHQLFSSETAYADFVSEQRYLQQNEPSILMKVCCNPSCNIKESRFGQFKKVRTPEDAWYCSRLCHNQIKRVTTAPFRKTPQASQGIMAAIAALKIKVSD